MTDPDRDPDRGSRPDGGLYVDQLPMRLPAWLVGEAEKVTGGPAACYVVDIAGTSLRRVLGSEELPEAIALHNGVGPEIGVEGVRELRAELETLVAGAVLAPMWVHGRATAALVSARGTLDALERFAAAAAGAVEFSRRYTDVFEQARRHRATTAAAEIQQDLLGARLAPVTGGEVAGSLLPAYDIGGDWFDHAENADGVWLAVADAMGRGSRAAAVSALAIGAYRAARRAGGSLEDCCQSMDTVIADLGQLTYVTAVLAIWHPHSGELSWIDCGHPLPLLIAADGSVRGLEGESTHPFGMWPGERDGFVRNTATVAPGERLVLYSDGITDRRTADGGFLGLGGLMETLAGVPGATAAQTVIAVERGVRDAGEGDLADDATQLVLAVAG